MFRDLGFRDINVLPVSVSRDMWGRKFCGAGSSCCTFAQYSVPAERSVLLCDDKKYFFLKKNYFAQYSVPAERSVLLCDDM